MLDRRLGGGAGSTVIAGNQHNLGLALGHASSNGSNADFRNELHIDARRGVGVLQVVNKLREVFNRIDVVVRRRRNERHIRRGVAGACNPRLNLVAGQLPALAGLRALRHFDLEFVGIREIVARYAETARGDLLDGATAQVAIDVGIEAVGVFSALAAVALAADAIHGNREGFVRFLADRSVGHGASLEALDDRSPRFDFAQRNGIALFLEFKQAAQCA